MATEENKPEEVGTKLNIGPTPATGKTSILAGSKGLFIAILIVLIAVVIGISTLIGLKSADQYKGFIKKVEHQTQELKQENPLEAPADTPF